jgi:cytochrome c
MISAESHGQNQLTSAEQRDGWILLFDGKTTKGWRAYNTDGIGSAWKVLDGTFVFDPAAGETGGDVVTEQEFGDYELSLEWKIAACGNSGILFNVVEDQKYSAPWHTGPEMQILDNACHPDAKIHKHRAGDLYDLIACSTETVKPAGEWNHIRLISNKGHYEFWLNGTCVVKFTMHTSEWNNMVANSKFKEFPDFGKARKGHLALQDHGDKVWFRNIKIKTL